MISVTIADPKGDLYPFSKLLWNDAQVVYHGTWSAYSERIESEGFVRTDLPFDHQHVATVMDSREALDMGFKAANFFANGPGQPRAELSMTGNFWGARVYATDGGGEAVRLTIQDARDFEDFCASPRRRFAKRQQWEDVLRQCPNHIETRKALELLTSDETMNAFCVKVRLAREAIEDVIAGGFPVVYALEVNEHWFPASWERYIHRWHGGHRGAIELRCRRELITPDRIIAKAMYPKGTDKDFQPDGFETWNQLRLLPWASA
jgi:hypothetical protein